MIGYTVRRKLIAETRGGRQNRRWPRYEGIAAKGLPKAAKAASREGSNHPTTTGIGSTEPEVDWDQPCCANTLYIVESR